MREEIPRKLFHVLGLIYVAGFLWVPRSVLTPLLLAALVADGIWEWIRLHNEIVNQWFMTRFQRIVRKKEHHAPSGMFWMLLGALSVSVLVSSTPLAIAALLYLIIGDGLASLGGKFFKGPHWLGSKKRVSGSLVCFLCCWIVSVILVLPLCGWAGVWAGSLTATAIETGIIPLDDNFLIPFVSGLSLLAAGGQPFPFL